MTEEQEKNMAQDASFAITLARLEGRIFEPTSMRIFPAPKLSLQDFEFHSFAEANCSTGTNAPRNGKQSETVVRLNLEQGWFVIEIDPTEDGGGQLIDVDNRGRGCTLTIRARGEEEAKLLARLFELAGVSLRRQMEENLRSYLAQ